MSGITAGFVLVLGVTVADRACGSGHRLRWGREESVMATVSVDLSGLDSYWVKSCKQAASDLNHLFKKSGISVVLTVGGSTGPTITVQTDPAIVGTALHGRTTATTSGSGQLQSAVVRLPV